MPLELRESRSATILHTGKIVAYLGIGLLILLSVRAQAQSALPAASEKVIIDTDVGDDVDDAFAVALRSPEFEILGITTTFGDTETRAKLLDRMLGEFGRQNIPVAAGIPTHATNDALTLLYHEWGQQTPTLRRDDGGLYFGQPKFVRCSRCAFEWTTGALRRSSPGWQMRKFASIPTRTRSSAFIWGGLLRRSDGLPGICF